MKKAVRLIAFLAIFFAIIHKVDAETVFNKKITLYEKVVLYKEPKDDQKMNDSIAPQSVQAIEKSGNWIKIQTWMGPKWIKTIRYNEGTHTKQTDKLTLKSNTYLYNQPLDDARMPSLLGPQTVLSYEKINDWYLIETWMGPKWIKSANADVTEYKEKIYVPYTTILYHQNDEKSSTGMNIAPQTVTAVSKKGTWYQIQTWSGLKWINPVKPMFGEVKKEQKEVFIHYQASLYRVPFSDMKTGSSISPQTVKAFENWTSPSGEKWLHIRTWTDDMWVKQDETIPYTVELSKWGIYNDGTHSMETTKGFNNLLKWANESGIKHVYVPKGTYLIDKDNRINMVSNMTFELDKEAILQKETNGYEEYNLIYIGPLTENIVVKGGTLKGDRDTHDYSQKGAYTGGTHEWGYGVNIAGGRNITVEGMNIQKFTGDGVAIGGSTIGGGGTLNSSDFELGGLDQNGKPTNEAGKIRTVGKTKTNFDRIKNERHRVVNMWLPQGLTNNDFDVCYYTKEDVFISCDKGMRVYSIYSEAPKNAYYYRAVFNAASTSGVEVQWMVIEDAKGIVIKNNDIGYNRRQGITAGGEDVQILNNKIHHTGGTAPSSGIDIEPGYFPATNHTIKGNTFLDNKIQVVLCWGINVAVDDNYFEQTSAITGGVGLYIYPMYKGTVSVTNNQFKGSGFSIGPENAEINHNKFMNSTVSLNGKNQLIQNSYLVNSTLGIGNEEGQKAENVIIENTGEDAKYKGNLSVGGKTTTLTDITLKGIPGSPATIGGYSAADTVFERLTMINGISGATGMPSGFYKNSTFIFTGEKTSNLAVQYNGNATFDHSSFKNVTVSVNTETAEATLKDSSFIYDKDMNAPAVYAPAAKNIQVLHNQFTAKNLTNAGSYIVKIGQYSWTNRPAKVFGASVKENNIETNLAVKGIDTKEAGIGAPSYIIQNNNLYNAKLSLMEKDTVNNNQELLN